MCLINSHLIYFQLYISCLLKFVYNVLVILIDNRQARPQEGGGLSSSLIIPVDYRTVSVHIQKVRVYSMFCRQKAGASHRVCAPAAHKHAIPSIRLDFACLWFAQLWTMDGGRGEGTGARASSNWYATYQGWWP